MWTRGVELFASLADDTLPSGEPTSHQHTDQTYRSITNEFTFKLITKHNCR